MSRRLWSSRLGTVLFGHGVVVASAVHTSSGHPSLDQAALEMLHRAQPLPLPPPEVEGNPLHLVVPVRFHLN